MERRVLHKLAASELGRERRNGEAIGLRRLFLILFLTLKL
jgi:hypothetical protein